MKKLFHQPLYKLGCFTKNHVVSRRVILGALLSLMTLPVFAETSNGIGVFSVSATKVVTFSPGNLQYHPKNDEWRFAENQYDIIGEDNKNISTDYDGWIDLFGWSASDGSAKFGVSSSDNNNDYVGDFVDWGKNQIGSDAPDTWRTMTMDEWCYLCNTRMKADSLRGLGRINGVAGLILLPDNWTCPVGVTFDSYKVQRFTINEWSRLEAEGAVFLPCAGFRYGSDVNSVNSRPTYWSSTEREEGITAYYINLVDRKEASYYLYTGLSVRLVKDVVRLDQDTHPIHVDTTTTKVTSTLGQMISKAVRINISDLLGSNITITGTSDNSAFTVVDLENVSSGEQNLIVNYTPTAVTDGIETATITLYNSTLEGSTSFTMTGRHLPAEFAIISKIGDQWYALPSDNPNATAVLVSVDDDTNPTMGVTMTPENVKWSLKTPNNSAVDRFVLTNPNNQYLNADANGALQMNTTYNNCEWQPVTDDLNEYQLSNAGNTKNLGISQQKIFGTLDDNISDVVRLVSIYAETTKGVGVFSVSATKQVTFSPGNLQYHPKNQEWRFAPSQLDYVGKEGNHLDNVMNPSYDGWLDLFGWSTEKTNFGLSTTSEDYTDGSFVDWGINQISGNAPNTWRTLTNDEWGYILNERPYASSLHGIAQVNGVNGLVLLPDNWTCPAGVTFKSGFHEGQQSSNSYADYQKIDVNEWSVLEAAGAVFLPAAGIRRWDDAPNHQAQYGRCWTASENGTTSACYLYFLSNKAYMNSTVRSNAQSVRLAQDLHPIQVDATTTKVTSTVGQTISKAVRINISDLLGSNITIIGTSDNSAFEVVTLENVSSGEQNLIVNYTPTAVTDGIETATITLSLSCGTIENLTSFTMTGRHLPEKFAVISKVGNQWYAMPSTAEDVSSAGVQVVVDDNDDPTQVTLDPENISWSLKQPKTSTTDDRFILTNPNGICLRASTYGTLQINTLYNSASSYCEWLPASADLKDYKLNNVDYKKNLSISEQKIFSTSNYNASDVVRLVPIAEIKQSDIQVVEWYPTKVLLYTKDYQYINNSSTDVYIDNKDQSSAKVVSVGRNLVELSGINLINSAGKQLTIHYSKGSGYSATTYGQTITIPVIISGQDANTSSGILNSINKNAYQHLDLVVRDNATLSINSYTLTNNTFQNVFIHPTAKIVVPQSRTLNVNSLTFWGGIDEIYAGSSYSNKKYEVPQLVLKGSLQKTNAAIDYIMRVDLEQMYSLALPYDVAFADISYWDGEAMTPGTQLYVSTYNGQARANLDMKNTWLYETEFPGQKLTAGVGYTISAEPQAQTDPYALIRMSMKNNLVTSEQAKTIAVTAYANQNGVTISDNHKGWNLVGNPYMASIKGDGPNGLVLGYLVETGTGPWEWVNDGVRYVTIPSDDGTYYWQEQFKNATLKPFKNFFVQIATTGQLSFALDTRQNAPARYLQNTHQQETEFEIQLSSANMSDHTGFLVSEQYSPAYEINADLEKILGPMSLYSIYGGYSLAYNALCWTDAEQQISLGYRLPETGEYTLSMRENALIDSVQHVYLTDHVANVVVDLLDGEYQFISQVKENEDRFTVQIIRGCEKNGTTTAINDIEIHNDCTQKIYHQGQLFIVRKGNIYNTLGQKVTKH